MKKLRAFFLAVYLIPLLGFCCISGFNFALDPDHIFTKGGDYPYIAQGRRYYKLAGMIDSYEMKNIVLGASLMNNTIPSEVEAVMGWKDVFALTKNGADPGRLFTIARHAFRLHKIDNVIFGLEPDRMAKRSIESMKMAGALSRDDLNSSDDAERRAEAGAARFGAPSDSFLFLFDENRLNDLGVYAQLPWHYVRSWRDSHEGLRKLEQSLGPQARDKEILAASKDLSAGGMAELYRSFNRPLFISSLLDPNEPLAEVTESLKRNVQENYELYLKPLVENNPKTTFHFLLLPGPFYAKKPKRELNAYVTKFLAERLLRYPNVKIHAFLNDGFNADLRLFADYAHYHIEVARFILHSIAREDHLLTMKNLAAYLAEYRRLLENYSIPDLWRTEFTGIANGTARGSYPSSGYISYPDAARLVWGKKFSQKLFDSIPRAPILAEEKYVAPAFKKTWPPLDATRKILDSVK